MYHCLEMETWIIVLTVGLNNYNSIHNCTLPILTTHTRLQSLKFFSDFISNLTLLYLAYMG